MGTRNPRAHGVTNPGGGASAGPRNRSRTDTVKVDPVVGPAVEPGALDGAAAVVPPATAAARSSRA
jgi:hypothetical protein